MNTFQLRSNALPYLLLQRTQYQRPIPRFVRGRILRNVYNRYLVGPFHIGRTKQVAQCYFDDMLGKFGLIEPVLAKRNVRKVLDIGAGLAGINAVINERFQHNGPIDFYLLDKDMISSRIYYFFEEDGAAYNSFDITRSFLIANGIESQHLHFIDINREHFPSDIGFDVVISLISWGFHYPVDVYVDHVYEALIPGGVLIMDIRRNTDGLETLRSRFNSIEILEQETKYIKVAAEK